MAACSDHSSRGEHRDSDDGTSKSSSTRVHRRPRGQKGFEERPERSHEGMRRSRGDMAEGGAKGGHAARKQLIMPRAAGGDLASWLYESGRRRRRLPTTEVERHWTVFTTITALLQLKATRTTRATRRVSAMLDPMTRAFLLTLTLLADTGGARLGSTAARRAVRLQRRGHQRPQGEAEGQGCVYAWFGEGFLYIGYATVRQGGVQNELAGPAYRRQEHACPNDVSRKGAGRTCLFFVVISHRMKPVDGWI